jgi:hypothetical protein
VQRSPVPVEAGHDKRFTWFEEGMRNVELGPLSVPAGALVGKDPTAPRGFECVDLAVEILL